MKTFFPNGRCDISVMTKNEFFSLCIFRENFAEISEFVFFVQHFVCAVCVWFLGYEVIQ